MTRALPLVLLTLGCGPNVSPLAGLDTDPGDTASPGSGTTNTNTNTNTGGTTGTATGGATNLGDDGALRVVNLADGALGVTLGGAATINLDFATATDAGADYTVLPAGAADVGISVGGSSIGSMGVSLYSGVYQTLILTGSPSSPSGLTLTDTVAPAAPGSHEMTVWHVSPTAGPADLIVSGFNPATLNPGAGLGLSAPSGPVTIGLDVNQDGTADLEFPFTLPDGDWSYLYLWHGSDPARLGQAFNHVRGQPIDTPAPL